MLDWVLSGMEICKNGQSQSLSITIAIYIGKSWCVRQAYLRELTMQLVVPDAMWSTRRVLYRYLLEVIDLPRKKIPYVYERLCEPIRKIGRNFLTYRSKHCYIHCNYTEVLYFPCENEMWLQKGKIPSIFECLLCDIVKLF